MVTSSPSGVRCDSACNASYASETSVALTATADSGSTFAFWSGGACAGAGSYTASVTAAQSVTATFNTSSASTDGPKSGFGCGQAGAEGLPLVVPALVALLVVCRRPRRGECRA